MIEGIELKINPKLSFKNKTEIINLIINGIRDYVKSPFLKHSKTRSINNKLNNFIVLYKDKEIVGFLMYRKIKNIIYIYEIHVAKKWRSKGLGEIIINKLFEIASYSIITLFVHKNNFRAYKFYLKNNFEIEKDYESDIYYMMKKAPKNN